MGRLEVSSMEKPDREGRASSKAGETEAEQDVKVTENQQGPRLKSHSSKDATTSGDSFIELPLPQQSWSRQLFRMRSRKTPGSCFSSRSREVQSEDREFPVPWLQNPSDLSSEPLFLRLCIPTQMVLSPGQLAP